MKKTIIVVALLIALSSCKKCYVCTTSTTQKRVDGSIYGYGEVETNFCGTSGQKQKHENEASSATPYLIIKMTCVAE